MLTYTAKEAKNRFGELMQAVQNDQVEITFHGKPHARMISTSGLRQRELDRKKHEIACKVVELYSLDEIRKKSLENLKRWAANGVAPLVYKEWEILLKNGSDRELLVAMIGLNDNSNRLRQSPPYVGMLRASHEEKST